MNATQLIAYCSIAAVAVSVAAIYITLRGVLNQLRVTVFITYTERFAKVMSTLPFEARRPGSDYHLTADPAERVRIFGIFRDYLNLCSEEMWLRQQHRIDRATWQIWERGMRQVAQFPPFRAAWQELACEYDYYREFQDFVNKRLLTDIPGPRKAAGEQGGQKPVAAGPAGQ